MNPDVQAAPPPIEVPEAGPGPDDVWPLFIQFVLSLKSWWTTVCAELDITPMQGHALRALDPDRPIAMSLLAESLACEPSNVTGIVDKLESRGFIARQSVGHDRRVKMLVLTEEGKATRTLLRQRMETTPEAVAALPATTRKQLATILRDVLISRGALKP